MSVAEVIVTMLPDGKAVRDVALGENGIAAAAKPGTIVVDMSSSQPLVGRDTGAALARKKITLIDAPVSGGVAKALSGTLTIMIGGDDPAAIERVKPVLACMGTIVNVSTGQSFIFTVVMKQFVLTETFNTGFAIGLLAKDANIAAELSQGLGCKSPHIELTSRRWAQARDSIERCAAC